MKKVAVLTLQQKNDLYNQELYPGWGFNPFMDNNLNWVITEVEIDNCTNTNFAWVKSLPLIDYIPLTEYQFLQFLNKEDAELELQKINNCLSNIAQLKPYEIYEGSLVNFTLIGYAIITTEEVKSCLTPTEIDNILTSTINDIVINII